MKVFSKFLTVLALGLAVVFFAVGCSSHNANDKEECDHEWENATCEEPKTCSECGETKGKKAEHEWEDATCEKPKTCSVCGLTEGELGEHLLNKGVCEVCGINYGYQKLYNMLKDKAKFQDEYIATYYGPDFEFFLQMVLNKDDEIFWCYYDGDGVMYMEMQLYEGSVTQKITMTYKTADGKNKYTSSGEILSFDYSPEKTNIYSFKTDFYYSEETMEGVFEDMTQEMFMYAAEVFEDTDITMGDLGFTAYQEYLDKN